jgi:hypothetical protein
MKKWFIYTLVAVLISVGAQSSFPAAFHVKASNKVSLKTAQEQTIIRHIVQENDVFVECMVPGVSFTGATKGARKGKIVVFVDGLRKAEYHTAAFIMKDVPRGSHLVKVEIYNQKNKSLGISRNFYVTIS